MRLRILLDRCEQPAHAMAHAIDPQWPRTCDPAAAARGQSAFTQPLRLAAQCMQIDGESHIDIVAARNHLDGGAFGHRDALRRLELSASHEGLAGSGAGNENGCRSVRRMASAQQRLVQRELSDEHAVQRNHAAVRCQGAGAQLCELEVPARHLLRQLRRVGTRDRLVADRAGDLPRLVCIAITALPGAESFICTVAKQGHWTRCRCRLGRRRAQSR